MKRTQRTHRDARISLIYELDSFYCTSLGSAMSLGPPGMSFVCGSVDMSAKKMLFLERRTHWPNTCVCYVSTPRQSPIFSNNLVSMRSSKRWASVLCTTTSTSTTLPMTLPSTSVAARSCKAEQIYRFALSLIKTITLTPHFPSFTLRYYVVLEVRATSFLAQTCTSCYGVRSPGNESIWARSFSLFCRTATVS